MFLFFRLFVLVCFMMADSNDKYFIVHSYYNVVSHISYEIFSLFK